MSDDTYWTEAYSQEEQDEEQINEIDHEYTDNPVCPYCGREYVDDEGYFTNEEGFEEECDECGKKFYISANISVSYTSKKLCIQNGMEHNYEYEHDFEAKNGGKYNVYICKNCEDIDLRLVK